eukprot:347612-Chlamydomonas_euryale.AAC.1
MATLRGGVDVEGTAIMHDSIGNARVASAVGALRSDSCSGNAASVTGEAPPPTSTPQVAPNTTPLLFLSPPPPPPCLRPPPPRSPPMLQQLYEVLDRVHAAEAAAQRLRLENDALQDANDDLEHRLHKQHKRAAATAEAVMAAAAAGQAQLNEARTALAAARSGAFGGTRGPSQDAVEAGGASLPCGGATATPVEAPFTSAGIVAVDPMEAWHGQPQHATGAGGRASHGMPRSIGLGGDLAGNGVPAAALAGGRTPPMAEHARRVQALHAHLRAQAAAQLQAHSPVRAHALMQARPQAHLQARMQAHAQAHARAQAHALAQTQARVQSLEAQCRALQESLKDMRGDAADLRSRNTFLITQ